jgi:putative lipoprotein
MRVAVALCLCVASLLPLPAQAARVELSGQVTYRERIALPPTAMLEIQLVDQTLPNLPPRLDVRGPIGPGQVPLSFTLSFEDSLILPGHSYALIAAIRDQAGLLFRNFEPYPVDPLAPALPVVVVTNLVGRVQTAEASCSEPAEAPPPAILDAIWTATSIGGKPVIPRTSPTLSIGDDLRAGGSTGCNSWFAEAELTGEDMLHLGSITSTLKACQPNVDQQERAFKDALTAAATWKVSGDELTLYGVEGAAVMVLRR